MEKVNSEKILDTLGKAFDDSVAIFLTSIFDFGDEEDSSKRAIKYFNLVEAYCALAPFKSFILSFILIESQVDFVDAVFKNLDKAFNSQSVEDIDIHIDALDDIITKLLADENHTFSGKYTDLHGE